MILEQCEGSARIDLLPSSEDVHVMKSYTGVFDSHCRYFG
jgi:hypothetical protein